MSRLTLTSIGLAAATLHRARRARGVPARSLASAAARSWRIAPSVDEPFPRSFVPEAHFARMQKASPPTRSIEAIAHRLTRERHVGRETRAYLLRDAALLGASIYCNMHRLDLYRGPSAIDALLHERVGELDHAVLATTYSGSRWFAHFLYDELPLQMLAATLGQPVGHVRPAYRHEAGWRARLGVEAPHAYGMLHARELVVIDDVGQNLEKRARYRSLRARLAHLPRGHERVYLRRGNADGERRGLVNADVLERRLQREGFAIVDTGTATLDEITRACAGASLVVSIEGSHATPALFLAQEGACLLFLCPPQRVTEVMVHAAGFFGLLGGLFVGEPVAGPETLFTVDPDELMQVIDHAALQANALAARLDAS